MFDKARKIVSEKENYAVPDPYSGHLINENSLVVAQEYFLNDDLNCS